jgi:hypothetical protein
MIGQLFFLTAFLLIFSPTHVSADTLPKSITTAKAMGLKPAGSPCKNTQYTQNKFRPEVIKDLPFPPGAFVELNNCDNADFPEKPESAGEASKREAIQKQQSIEKLSLLLSIIYHQQKNLEGSYRESDQAYQELLRKNLPNLETYDQALGNYEDALKNYGEQAAYLSALPRAVSDYEKIMGASFKDFAFQKADGAISLMKSPSPSDLSNPPYNLQVKTDDSAAAQETPGALKPEPGKGKEQVGSRRELCTVMGAVAGAGAAENIILASLANPMGVLLGASLGATLCSETVYGKISVLRETLGEGLVEMASYIKDGLGEIGEGLYNMGREYLYKTPSRTGAKIAEHYANTKSWLNRQLGWQ